MNHLVTTEAPTLTTRMMVGTSPGKHNKHVPTDIPLDAVTYMLRADLAAKERGADGIFLALDRRDPSDGVSCSKDALAISQRTEHLRMLVGRLTGLTYITESDLDAESLRNRRDGYPMEMFRGTPYPVYWQRQTAVVMETLGANEDDPSSAALSKFGWVMSRTDDGAPHGGEAEFDPYLPSSQGIEYVYAPPGYTASGEWAVPYLSTNEQRRHRIILPRGKNQIDRELAKLNGNLSQIAYRSWAATARVILGEAPANAVQAARITTMPLSADMRGPVDAARVKKLRDLLSASLTKLLP